MQLNTLQPRTKNKPTMIVGRGGKRGKTSGRGGKGQTARAGNKRRPELRDFIKRLPKLRGRGVNQNKPINEQAFSINVGELETVFKAGAEVNPASLLENKLVQTESGRIPVIKLLGEGELTKAFKISGFLMSAGAKAKIEKAGGSISAKPVKAPTQKVKIVTKPAEPKAKAPVAKPAEKTEKAPKLEKPAKKAVKDPKAKAPKA